MAWIRGSTIGGGSQSSIKMVDYYVTNDNNAASSKTTKTFTVQAGDTIFLAVMHRASSVTVPSGFSLVRESDNPLGMAENIGQTLSIYAKTISTNGTESYTVLNGDASKRIQLLSIQLRGVVNISSWSGGDHVYDSAGSDTYTIIPPNKPSIIFCHNAYSGGSGPWSCLLSYNPIGSSSQYCNLCYSGDTRMGAFIDNGNSVSMNHILLGDMSYHESIGILLN